MFWSEADLEELKGTAVVGRSAILSSPVPSSIRFQPSSSPLAEKVGQADAEKDFHNKILPAIQVLALRYESPRLR